MHTATEAPRRGLDPLDICTLDADDLEARRVWIRERILPRAIGREALADGLAVDLEDSDDLREALDRLVELERDCCSELVFEHAATGPGRRRLRIRGVDPNSSILAEAPLREVPPPPSPVRRVAIATGLGSVAGLLVCCGLPIAAAAVLGATVAAPLATLDQPLVIAGAAVLFGGAAHALLARRERERAPEPADDPSCGC